MSITIKDLVVSLKGTRILKGINLVVENTVALLYGTNGSGKTTLIRAISGLIPYSGSIKINGKEVRSAKNLLEYSTNLPEVYFIGNTVLDTAKIVAELKGGDLREFLELVERFGLESKKVINKPFYKLSTGERSLVTLSLALFAKPRVCTLDEPLENVDPQKREKVIRVIRERVKEGIIVTHDKDLVKVFSGTPVYTMIEGELFEGIKV
ncbi:ATP-binding cassette domain-containing protein [Sulfolobus acidocaldarius]|uniref:ATP-binding cassette domain-containing protein n=1 Tax=Sulfolobus acidocaldarius TaxID=2285 RepID=UPI000B1296A4|nr:ATP-binding cassette domain-containing protein [Sulfolobus acidocaldarius]